ncbi:MAG: dihydrolipoyllysine-residue succinyltransferase [Terrimicrobiaceae bacterium]|nr:dihydrolipoyllysine-residue succinyltransferase [Terrimicrobiaceae bacterium]
MSIEVKVPAVGESITSGLLSVWHKKDGESVASGEILFTLETDKVSTEVNATESGTLRIQVPEGEEVKIGQVVATIEASGAEAQAASKKALKPKKEEKPAVVEPPQAPAPAPAAEAPTPVAASDDARTTRKKLSPLRRKIATQLVAAQHTAAILTTFNECDMGAVMQLRKDMQDDFQKRHGIKLGFMSFFIKATVDALKAVSAVNSRLDGDDLITANYYDIGVAVGTERGLIVPVVRDCDQKSFAEIEQALADYAAKARDGKIGLDDLQGGVFTISNGGIYGSLMSTPILNPPQSGILGMHKIQERPIAVKGQVVVRPMMYLALSYDHRVVDGKEAVTFLVRVKDCIENPMRLLLGT